MNFRSVAVAILVRSSIYYWQAWQPQIKRDATTPEIAAPLTFEAYRYNVDHAPDAIALIEPTP